VLAPGVRGGTGGPGSHPGGSGDRPVQAAGEAAPSRPSTARRDTRVVLRRRDPSCPLYRLGPTGQVVLPNIAPQCVRRASAGRPCQVRRVPRGAVCRSAPGRDYSAA